VAVPGSASNREDSELETWPRAGNVRACVSTAVRFATVSSQNSARLPIVRGGQSFFDADNHR
jgi:hypothetical protein